MNKIADQYKVGSLTGIVFVVLMISSIGVVHAQTFNIAPNGPQDLTDLIYAIMTNVFYIAIPIAVIVIITSGILMLTAGGNPTKFEKARKMLGYAVAGLVVIFIGRGFISLIQSILDLR